MGDVHTKHNQQRAGSKGRIGKDLEKKECASAECCGLVTQKKALTALKVIQTLRVYLLRHYNIPDVGHRAHLTVYWR